MILKKLNIARILVILMLFSSPLFSLAQRKSEAITHKLQLAKLKTAVEVSIDSHKVHEAFINALGLENPELERQYAAWMSKYPKSVMVPYSIANAYLNAENPKARPYLLKAVEIDSNFTEAWGGLWVDGERWGDFKVARGYLARAVASNASNPNYAFYYASSFSGIDELKWMQLSLDVAKNFPDHERGAQALYWLAQRSKKAEDKLKYFELLKNSYKPEKFNWSSSGMTSYFNILITKNPERALTLAQELANAETGEHKQWPALVLQAKTVVEAKRLMERKQGKEAMTVLKQLKLPKYSSFKVDLALLKAEAEDLSGKTSAAYDSLIVTFAKTPSMALKNAIAMYGHKLGKSPIQTDADIWKRLDTVAQIATPFNRLKLYLTPGEASLADYKGKVVLLTYWFPGCGPCRGEFPHFENVVKKINSQDLAYLGINIVSDQNQYVIPFMKASGYSFTPLEEVAGRIKGNLDNRGAAPINFLIDKNGRVIFSNFRTDGNNEEDLELMINLLLNRNKV